MDPASALATVKSIQGALGVLAALSLTAFMYAPNTSIEEIKSGKSYDMIVVGAGAAGSLIAARLSEDKACNVLLIEAGGVPELEATIPALMTFVENTKADWNYTSDPDNFVPELHKNKKYHMSQGKMISGTDGFNYMVYVRGDPEDYNSWARVTNDDSWRYENILKYFKKTENLKSELLLNSPYAQYHGTNGKMKVTKMHNEIVQKYFKGIEQLGHERVLDTNGKSQLGFTEPLVTAYDGKRQSTAFSYLFPARNRQNMNILENAEVIEILFDDSNNAKGVKVAMETGEIIEIKANKEVIVSAGAFNSPKLLMLSGIGPKDELEKLGIPVRVDLPVGQNLQDHRMSPLVFKGLKTQEPTPPQDPGKVPVSAINGFVRCNHSQSYADYEVVMIVNPHDSPALTQLCTFTFKYEDSVCQKIADATVGREVLFTFIDHLLPLSRGNVTLKSKDYRDNPVVRLGFYKEEIDLINHAHFVKDFARLLTTDYMKSIDSELVDISGCAKSHKYNTEEFWKCYVLRTAQTVWHYCGSCSMGSVVDSRLRVFGVKGLRVADASIMSYMTRGNTVVPVYMIAEKAADMIKEDNGCCS